jgi:nucleoside 2-deoxyribosyltransferase
MKNSIFDFEHFLVYLAGPVEFLAKEDALAWRYKVTEMLSSIGIKENHIINPCKKHLNNFIGDDLDDAHIQIKNLKEEGNFKEIERRAKHTIRIDLRYVDKSDLIYAYINPNIYTFGTADEIGVARTARKPVIAVVEGGVKNSPLWLIGRIGYQNIFPSHEEAIKHISDIIHGKIPFDVKSWLFFNWDQK